MSASPRPAQSTPASYLIGASSWEGLPYVSEGHGVYLEADDGRVFLDGSSGALAASLGHGRSDLANVLREQAEKASFTHRSQMRNRPVEELAALLANYAPGDLTRSMFVSSGSDAVELALKIAVRYWASRGDSLRRKFLARDLSYHGTTIGSLSLTGVPARRQGVEHLLIDVARIPTPSSGANGGTSPAALLQRLSEAFQREKAGTIAAVVTEVISGGSGGVILPPPGYLDELQRLCREHGALLIVDEVMSGFGRTGRPFACEHFGVTPDLLVFGKGISGGYAPLAGVIATGEVAEAVEGIGGVGLGHTYMNVPIAAAVGLATARVVLDEEFLANVRERGEDLRAGLRQVQGQHPDLIADVRGVGLMNAVEFRGGSERQDAPTTTELLDACRESGLLLYPATSDHRLSAPPPALLVAPPLTIAPAEVDDLVARFGRAMLNLEDSHASELNSQMSDFSVPQKA